VTAPWLGAAAATLACDRMGWLLGGHPDRTLVPAELLDLPPRPSKDIPADLYEQASVRDRTLGPARARAAGYLDGRVTAKGETVTVELTVHMPDGVALGSATASAEWLEDAVAQALDALTASQALSRRTELDADVAKALGAPDPAQGILEMQVNRPISEGMPRSRVCPRLQTVARLDRPHAARVEVLCEGAKLPFEPIPPGASAAALFAHGSAYSPFGARNTEEIEAIESAVRVETSAVGSFLLRLMIANLRSDADGYEQHLGDFRDVVSRAPRFREGWAELSNVVGTTASAGAAALAYAAWRPDSAHAWTKLSLATADRTDTKRREAFARRSYRLMPTAMHGLELVRALLEEGDREEARGITARVANAADESERPAGVVGAILADVSERRFGAAAVRTETALAERSDLGVRGIGDGELMSLAYTSTRSLGDQASSARRSWHASRRIPRD
jgi:hypothetical protein